MEPAPTVWSVTTPQHPVRIGRGILQSLSDFVPQNVATCAIIADQNVAELHADAVRKLLAGQWRVETFLVPPGERHKTRATKEALEDAMLAAGLGRDTVVIALGGGVTIDLAGFTAATFLRGVPWVALPTSLLAAVDAGVGGKTAVNTPAGKNLVGAFHAPAAVLIDLALLETLPLPEWQNGLAEMVKHAIIADKTYLDDLLLLWRRGELPEDIALGRAIHRSVQIKARVTAEDPRETNLRQVLNLGHTIGHAIERVSDYRIGHGFAVAIGISAATALAVEQVGFAAADRTTILAALRACDLPTTIPFDLPLDRIVAATHGDKKARRGTARYVLPVAIGAMARGPQGGYGIEVNDAVVLAALQQLRDEE